MGNLANLNAVWGANITQLETTDPVEGGPGGIDNQPHRQLAERTLYLKAQVEDLLAQLNLKAASAHSHALGDVAGLSEALDGRALKTHDHAMNEVIGLESSLEGKAAKSHRHSRLDIVDLPQGAPVGVVSPYAGANPPTGWLLCDGSAVSRATYPDLYQAIGITWGQGDGATTFNLPDLRGRTLIGAGHGTGLTDRPLAEKGGEETHTLTVAEIPAHLHAFTAHQASGSGFGAGGGGAEAPTTQTKNTENAGDGGAHNNLPPYVAMYYIIKAN